MVDSIKYTHVLDAWMSPAGTLYFAGSRGIRQYNQGGWTILPGNPAISAMDGTGDDNIFALGLDGDGIFHYNGNDWFKYPNLQFGDGQMFDIWTDGLADDAWVNWKFIIFAASG